MSQGKSAFRLDTKSTAELEACSNTLKCLTADGSGAGRTQQEKLGLVSLDAVPALAIVGLTIVVASLFVKLT